MAGELRTRRQAGDKSGKTPRFRLLLVGGRNGGMARISWQDQRVDTTGGGNDLTPTGDAEAWKGSSSA